MPKRQHDGAQPRSSRQLKVAETVRRALSEILMRGDIHDPEIANYSITVSEVRASPDLRHMTAFVLPLGGEDGPGALKALKRCAGAFRRLVAQSVRLKYAPELHFVLDDTFDRADAMRRLLDDARVRRDVAAPDRYEPDEREPDDDREG